MRLQPAKRGESSKRYTEPVQPDTYPREEGLALPDLDAPGLNPLSRGVACTFYCLWPAAYGLLSFPAGQWCAIIWIVETSRIGRICDGLDECYGRAEWAYTRPVLDELIYTILSQNTTAKNCDQAFETLTRRFPTWHDVMGARVADVATAIAVGGLANRKAPRIQRILSEIFERQGNLDLEWIADTPDAEAIDYLLGFHGVGRKTAACVLMFGLGRPVLAVDTHVHRVAMRLGLIGKVSADAAHDLLQAMLEHPEPVEGEPVEGRVYSFHIGMVTHGRRVCHARGPQCNKCAINKECDFFVEQTGTGR